MAIDPSDLWRRKEKKGKERKENPKKENPNSSSKSK